MLNEVFGWVRVVGSRGVKYRGAGPHQDGSTGIARDVAEAARVGCVW